MAWAQAARAPVRRSPRGAILAAGFIAVLLTSPSVSASSAPAGCLALRWRSGTLSRGSSACPPLLSLAAFAALKEPGGHWRRELEDIHLGRCGPRSGNLGPMAGAFLLLGSAASRRIRARGVSCAGGLLRGLAAYSKLHCPARTCNFWPLTRAVQPWQERGPSWRSAARCALCVAATRGARRPGWKTKLLPEQHQQVARRRCLMLPEQAERPRS